MFASESYRNCLETERLLMKDIRDGKISPRDRAVCANALDRILERKRILRMRPAPKAVDAYKYEEQKRRRVPYESLADQAVEIEVPPQPPKSL